MQNRPHPDGCGRWSVLQLPARRRSGFGAAARREALAQLLALPRHATEPAAQRGSVLDDWRSVVANRSFLMFAAAIYLRYSQPNRPRPYRIPGGDIGMWLIGGLGFLGSLLAFVLSFIPPSQISVGSPSTRSSVQRADSRSSAT